MKIKSSIVNLDMTLNELNIIYKVLGDTSVNDRKNIVHLTEIDEMIFTSILIELGQYLDNRGEEA